MITKLASAPKRQPVIVFVLEAYVIIASIVSVAWNKSDAAFGPAFAYVICGCIVSTLGLLIAGTVLLVRRRLGSGWTALAVAAYGTLFLILFLPTLARAVT